MGDCDEPTHPHIVKAMQEAVADAGNQKYPSNRGREEFREAFADFYDERFGVITDHAPSTQTTVTPTVIASGIVRSGEDRVDVLVFVDRPTTNKLTPEPVTYKDQVTVTMQKVDGEWLIDNLVTSPAAGALDLTGLGVHHRRQRGRTDSLWS